MPAPDGGSIWSRANPERSSFRVEIVAELTDPEQREGRRTAPIDHVSPSVVNHGVSDAARGVRQLPSRSEGVEVVVARRPRNPAADKVSVLLWLVRVDRLDRVVPVRFGQIIRFVPDIFRRGHFPRSCSGFY